MRLAVVGLSHEANTFAPVAADLDEWQRAGVLEGDRIRQVHAGARSALAGYLGYAAAHPDVEVVPLIYSEVTPMAPSTSRAFEHLAGRIVAALREHGPWDGVLMPLHGAAVSERYRDADGELLRRVRAAVGRGVPVGATLDMHANISPAMVEQADVITAFQTNPHVDASEQGFACARLIDRTIKGEVRPVMSLADPPLAINILRQGTAEAPMAELLQVAREHECRPGVLAVFVVEGFPYADVPEMGMSVLAVADANACLARDAAGAVAAAAWARRQEFVGDALGVDDALKRAAAAEHGPVVLLDVGDNVGGGSPGDSTHVLHAARRLGVGGVAALLTDPQAVAECSSAGAGARVSLSVGGKTDDRHGAPLPVTGVVAAFSDGRFDDPTPTHGGRRYFDMGPTVRLSTDDGFELVLISIPHGTVSREQLRIVALEPAEQKIIVAKGVHSPRAAFEPVAEELVWAATPGCTAADLSTLSYVHRRRPMFPFEPATPWCQ
ncbi:MAG: M81 family metallopeptidase [Actinomycetota bacterium]